MGEKGSAVRQGGMALHDLHDYLPGLMVAAGGVLQWFRQFKMFREQYYHLIAVGLGIGAFWLVTPYTGEWRTWWLQCLDFLTIGGGGLAMIYGGTFLVSNTAKAVAAANPAAASTVAVPVTDSK